MEDITFQELPEEDVFFCCFSCGWEGQYPAKMIIGEGFLEKLEEEEEIQFCPYCGALLE